MAIVDDLAIVAVNVTQRRRRGKRGTLGRVRLLVLVGSARRALLRAMPALRCSLIAALAVTSIGCFRSHSREVEISIERDAGRQDGGRPDAGADAGTDAGRDAGTPMADAGWDAGSDAGVCLDERRDEPVGRACILDARGALPEGEAGVVTMGFADCLCDARRCEVSIEGGVIETSVVTCADRRECRDCQRELACRIPPLPAGDYELRFRGRPLAWLPVRAPTGSTTAHPTCWRMQDAPSVDRCAAIWPGNPPTSPLSVCHRDVEDVGTYAPIQVTVECPVCHGYPGQCSVRLDGRRLVVDATIRECGCARCDACPDCGSRTAELHCSTPPLPIGDYEIVVAGTSLRSTFRVRDVATPGPLVCTSAP